MKNDLRERVIVILKQLLQIEDGEIKDCAIESLIEMLEDCNDDNEKGKE